MRTERDAGRRLTPSARLQGLRDLGVTAAPRGDWAPPRPGHAAQALLPPAARHRGVTEGLRSWRAAAVPLRARRHEDLDLGARIRVSARRGWLRVVGRRLLPPFSRLPRFPSVGDWRSFPASGPLCPGRLDAGPSSDWAAAAPPLLQGPLRAPRGLCWGRSREIRGLKTAPIGGS